MLIRNIKIRRGWRIYLFFFFFSFSSSSFNSFSILHSSYSNQIMNRPITTKNGGIIPCITVHNELKRWTLGYISPTVYSYAYKPSGTSNNTIPIKSLTNGCIISPPKLFLNQIIFKFTVVCV